MFLTTAQGIKWAPDLFLHVVSWCQVSWRAGCWPVQQSETEAAYLPPQAVPLGFVLGEIMSILGPTVSIQTRSVSSNVLIDGLIWERQFCSWSLLHDVALLKASCVSNRAQWTPSSDFFLLCISLIFRSVVGWLGQREGLILEETTPWWGIQGNIGSRRRGERQSKALWGTILLL